MSRIDRTTNERTTVRPEPAEQKPGEPPLVSLQLGHGDAALAVRSGHDLHRRQHGAEVDRPRPLVPPISPDLTTNTDRETLSIMGVAGKDIKHRQERRRQLVRQHRHARGIARRRPGVVWAGTDDGVVSVTQDAGKTWTNVTAKIPGRAEVDLRRRRAAVARAGGHGLRRVRRPSRRRLQHLRVHDDRLRRHVALDRRATCRRAKWRAASPRIGRTPTCCISAPRPACGCRWNRGGAVDAHQGQPADDADLRDQAASARQRPDPGDPRARHLDSRRPRRRSSSGRSPRAPTRSLFDTEPATIMQPGQRSDEGLRGRSAVPRPESGARRDAGVPAEGRCQGREVHDQGRAAAAVGARDHRRRRCAIATRPA